jgi:hypothetical protein
LFSSGFLSSQCVLNSTSLWCNPFCFDCRVFCVSNVYFFYTRIFFLDACLTEQSWGEGWGGDGAVVVCSLMALPATLALSPLRSLARWLLDNKVTWLAAQISFVCDAIFFLATISPNFASWWCQSANGRSIRRLYSFSCFFFFFFPTSRSRSQLISSASNRSLCRICNSNHLSTSIPVPKFPGCAFYSIDLLFLLAL